MRPKIDHTHNIAKTLQYNEQKITLGKAECLVAANFLKDLPRLSFEDKLNCFKRRMELNERVESNQHITLNFDPLDQLSNDQMKKIAMTYMKEIGFGYQPYLVYRHYDAGHPHCHIVTTHIQGNGDPIDLSFIGARQSEKARKYIESLFDLVTGEKKQRLRQQQQQQQTRTGPVQKVIYGEGSTTQSISRVVEHVMQTYKYTSLKEFNTALRLYNVEAYGGKANSTLYQNRGLLYRVLTDEGKYIGRPLKASFFDCKPTLDNLEQQFKLHLRQSLKQQHLERVTLNVRYAIVFSDNMYRASLSLARDNIRMVLSLDKRGKAKEVEYIHWDSHCIYTGEELGKGCNLAAVQQVLDRQQLKHEKLKLEETQQQTPRHRLRISGL